MRNFVGKSCGKSCGKFCGKFCGKILWEILREILWENLVRNSCGKSGREGVGDAGWGDNIGGVANSFNYIRNSSCV